MVFLTMERRLGARDRLHRNREIALWRRSILIDVGRRAVASSAGAQLVGGARAAGALRSMRPGWEASPALVAEANWTAAAGEAALQALLIGQMWTPSLPATTRWRWAHCTTVAGSQRRVPEDISIVGFDNTSSRLSSGPRSRQCASILAELGGAWRWMNCMGRIYRQRPGKEMVAPTALQQELIVRESSGKTDAPCRDVALSELTTTHLSQRKRHPQMKSLRWPLYPSVANRVSLKSVTSALSGDSFAIQPNAQGEALSLRWRQCKEGIHR